MWAWTFASKSEGPASWSGNDVGGGLWRDGWAALGVGGLRSSSALCWCPIRARPGPTAPRVSLPQVHAYEWRGLNAKFFDV